MAASTTELWSVLLVFCIVTMVYNAISMQSFASPYPARPDVDIRPDLDDIDLPPSPGKTTASITVKTPNISPENSYRLERNVFKKLVERFNAVNETCNRIPSSDTKEAKADFDTGIPPLPEHGLKLALQDWILKDDGETDRVINYPMCQLPPPTLCETTSYSVILMAHTVSDNKRLGIMTSAIVDFVLRPSTAEIILVWNSEREILTNSTDKRVKELMHWEQDTSHPLRIFYSLENGLGNNLLNRYHPSIQPSEEAVIYFDDDGPFFGEDVMNTGLQLWKLYSDTQVGSMPRNIRFTSKRMSSLHEIASTTAVKLHSENAWETHVSPYDMSDSGPDGGGVFDSGKYPDFTPVCNKQSGDSVEYNYFDFPHFGAHMFLPSGTILHRNYLCFIWHPVFEELRKYVINHPTHPDDIVVSTLVSHLSGRILRTFPRRIKNAESAEAKQRKRTEASQKHRKLRQDDSPYSRVLRKGVDQEGFRRTRRLGLWNSKNWAKMREEAMNSIVNYFGSVNPGSVGWCVGTKYEERNKRGKFSFKCNPEYPDMEQIPWINEDNDLYDHCQ